MVRVLQSNGEPRARAYTSVVLSPSPPRPLVEEERVQIVDPRQTSTVRSGTPWRGSGPRSLEQRVWPPAKPPAIDLPDGLPADKAQRVFVDPELAAQWRAEANQKETA